MVYHLIFFSLIILSQPVDQTSQYSLQSIHAPDCLQPSATTTSLHRSSLDTGTGGAEVPTLRILQPHLDGEREDNNPGAGPSRPVQSENYAGVLIPDFPAPISNGYFEKPSNFPSNDHVMQPLSLGKERYDSSLEFEGGLGIRGGSEIGTEHLSSSRYRNSFPIDSDTPLTAIRGLAVSKSASGYSHGLDTKFRDQLKFLAEEECEGLLAIYFGRMWGRSLNVLAGNCDKSGKC